MQVIVLFRRHKVLKQLEKLNLDNQKLCNRRRLLLPRQDPKKHFKQSKTSLELNGNDSS